MIAVKTGSSPSWYHAYQAYNLDPNYPEKKALACGVMRKVNHIACPAILRRLGKSPVFTYVAANRLDRIQPYPNDIAKRWCFGCMDTTYDPSVLRDWKTYCGGAPVKGFIPSVIMGNGANIYVDPETSSTSTNSFNFWTETVQTNSGITPALGGWGALVQSPVSGGDTRVKRALYNENDGTNRSLSSVDLTIGNLGSFQIAFYINVMLNLDVWMPSETDFYPGSEKFDISLIGGYNTRTDNDWSGLTNQGYSHPVVNNGCGNIPMAEEFPTKYKKSGSGTSSDPTIVEMLLRGYYVLKYPVGSSFNPLKIAFPGFRLGPYSTLQAHGRVYIVRGYAMTIEAVYEPIS